MVVFLIWKIQRLQISQAYSKIWQKPPFPWQDKQDLSFATLFSFQTYTDFLLAVTSKTTYGEAMFTSLSLKKTHKTPKKPKQKPTKKPKNKETN